MRQITLGDWRPEKTIARGTLYKLRSLLWPFFAFPLIKMSRFKLSTCYCPYRYFTHRLRPLPATSCTTQKAILTTSILYRASLQINHYMLSAAPTKNAATFTKIMLLSPSRTKNAASILHGILKAKSH